MATSHEWLSLVGLFLNAAWNAWALLLSGALIAASLLFVETMVLRRKPSRLGYTMILVLSVVSACFVAWQEQYLLTRDYENKLQSSVSEKGILASQFDELSKLVEQQERVLDAKSNAMASLEAKNQTARRALATQKEKYRSTYARARLASLRAEGLRLAQKMIANPTGPTPDFEIQVWSEVTERTLYNLFHQEQIQQFQAVEKAVLTYAKPYADDYISRSGGVLVKEKTQEIINGFTALLITRRSQPCKSFRPTSRQLN